MALRNEDLIQQQQLELQQKDLELQEMDRELTRLKNQCETEVHVHVYTDNLHVHCTIPFVFHV